MSPHAVKRVALSSSNLLWLVLALSLVAWRVSSRVQQYEAPIAHAEHLNQVSFFDVNERSSSYADPSLSHSPFNAETADRLFKGAVVQPAVCWTHRSRWEPRPALTPGCIVAVALLSNPPPNLS